MNDNIERTLRIKRPAPRRMIDGTYEVTAYWGDNPDWRAFTTKTVIVEDGIARREDGRELNFASQAWLRAHHIPTSDTPDLR